MNEKSNQEKKAKLICDDSPTKAFYIEYMKDRLKNYKLLNRDIDNNIERLERLENKMYSASSPNLSGMPKPQNNTPDKFADLISRKEELLEKVNILIENRNVEKEKIEKILSKVRNPDERAVINMRYLDSENWNDIIEMLFGVKENIDDDYDNYKQRVFRLHSSAIKKMALVIYNQQ